MSHASTPHALPRQLVTAEQALPGSIAGPLTETGVPPAEVQIVPRFHYMDALRSILMLSVVLLHAANIYAVSKTWRVKDPDGSVVFDCVRGALALFVMPAFFIIAGFFTLISLRKSRASGFLSNRLRRLGVPLASTALLVNSIESYLCHLSQAQHPLGILTFVQTELPTTWRCGDWVSHLWFLNVLIWFSIAAATCYRCFAGSTLLRSRYAGMTLNLLAWNFAFLLILPLYWFLPLALGKLFPTLLYSQYCFGFLDPMALLKYVPFFLFGIWLAYDNDLQSQFTTPRVWHVVAALAALTVFQLTDGDGAIAEKCLHIYARGLLTWLACLFAFSLARRFLDSPSRVFAYLSDASYTVYLLHHVVVIAAGLVLIRSPIGPAVKFPLVVFTAVATGLLIHHFLVLRIGLVRFLFNGTFQHQAITASRGRATMS